MCIPISYRCLLGCVFLKMGQSLLFTWGKCNIYYYSYYRESDPDLSIQYNTLPIAIAAIPMAILSLVSMKLARSVGFSLLIRLVSLIQCAILILSFLMPTYLTFILFYLVLNGCCFAVVVYPILNCAWSHFTKNEGKVSGLLMGIYSLAVIVFILLITYLVNPDNVQATLQGEAGKTHFHYFDHDVAKNVPHAVLIASITAGSLILLGSLLVTHNEEANAKTVKQDTKDTTSNEVELESQHPQSQNRSDKRIDEDDILPDTDLSAPAGFTGMQSTEQKIPQMRGAVKEAVLSVPFIVLFVSQFCLYFYTVTLSTNYKTYALSKYNNDHYVTYVDLVSQFVGGSVSFVWGFLADNIVFTWLYCGLVSLAGVFSIVVAFTTGKTNFTAFFIIYVVFNKGALLVVNPGLVKIYSNDLGTKLLTILNMSTVLAAFFAPLFQFILADAIEFDYILGIEGIMIIVSGFLISRIQMVKPEGPPQNVEKTQDQSQS